MHPHCRLFGRFSRALVVGALFVVAASHVLGVFMSTWGFRGDDPRYDINALLERSALRSFSQRLLSPVVVRVSVDMIPERLTDTHADWLLAESPLLKYRQPGESWDLT